MLPQSDDPREHQERVEQRAWRDVIEECEAIIERGNEKDHGRLRSIRLIPTGLYLRTDGKFG